VKPWQTIGKSNVDKPKSELTCDDKVLAINHIMSTHPGFWAEAGKKRPRVCQFDVKGERGDESWYVQVDATGGSAKKGRHPEPTVIWISDVDALRSAFAGKLEAGRVTVLGDFDVMREVFKAIAHSKPA
jgi:hypothetical protein